MVVPDHLIFWSDRNSFLSFVRFWCIRIHNLASRIDFMLTCNTCTYLCLKVLYAHVTMSSKLIKLRNLTWPWGSTFVILIMYPVIHEYLKPYPYDKFCLRNFNSTRLLLASTTMINEVFIRVFGCRQGWLSLWSKIN